MKTISIIAIATAIALAAPSANAQLLKLDANIGGGSSSSSGGSAGNGGITVDADVLGDKTLDVNANVLGLEANADADALNPGNSNGNVLDTNISLGSGNTSIADIRAAIDLNGDGLLTQSELEDGESALDIDLDIGLLDTNGDGVVDESEFANGVGGGNGGSGVAAANCAVPDQMKGDADMRMLVNARNFVVVEVPDCVAVSGSEVADIQTVLAANSDALQALRAEQANLGDVVGAATSTSAVTLFVGM